MQTEEYNRRARALDPQSRVPERTMPSLIQLGKKLRFCNCMPGQHCYCEKPEFPTIDGPGEPSSRVSLGIGGSGVQNSHHAATEASQILQTVSSELLRLRKAWKFSWGLLEKYSVVWQNELNTGLVFGKLFLRGSDAEKVKLTRRVYTRQ
ncbi:uncharacterized protein LOC141676910 isoform X1 [Apium graveolens]|uniref:uncharacterized protein LOC141676910 isoform X1 n=2 Tax=Apium graveolens TaxID=4045 RepID=UPI003D7A819B